MSLTSLSITTLREKLASREVSPVEALDALEARIAATEPQLHGYLSRDYALARSLAEKADVSLPLGGVGEQPHLPAGGGGDEKHAAPLRR